MKRRSFLQTTAAWAATGFTGVPSLMAGPHLPTSRTVIGPEVFERIVAKAVKEGWFQDTMGDRMTRIGLELRGIPYKGFTLEIDDRIESPSVNFHGLDCWTFFEAAMGMARMLETQRPKYLVEHLLAEIEWTRYRGGVCNGNYLDRIHYLAEWYFDNEARGNIRNLTRQIGPAERIVGRRIEEMTILWKSYRYLRENPDLRGPMKESEDKVAQLPVYFIPKAKVKAAEASIKNGDVIGIVTKHHGGFCSHVGLALRTKDGVTRLMHASSTHKQVWVDESISNYLHAFDKHAGILVGRPLSRSSMITDRATYLGNLRRLTSVS
jgi:hypothetical protein